MAKRKQKAASGDKGKRGEREVAALLRGHGYEARRGQQFSGGDDSPDVVHSISAIHIEVKYVEKFSLYDALDQAYEDAAWGDAPVVFFRRNRKPWVVIMDADEFLALIKKDDDDG